MLLIDVIREKIGPPLNGACYSLGQTTAFTSAVEAKASTIRQEAEPWAYIASPIYAGGLTGGIQWQVLTPECEQSGNQRQQIFIFESCLEVTAINLAGDLSTAAEIRLYREDALLEKDPVQIEALDEDCIDPIDPNAEKPSLIPPPESTQ